MADDDESGYTWEGAYEKTWEGLEEDELGAIGPSVRHLLHEAKRKRLAQRRQCIKLGIMRHVYVILDQSVAMDSNDLLPDRFRYSLQLLNAFIGEFYDQNPISQLGFITMKDKRAEKISELTGNARKHKDVLSKLGDSPRVGEASLQNALQLALNSLKHLPSHSSREVILIFGSLTTCDPDNIQATIQVFQELLRTTLLHELLKNHSIRCTCIGLAAEVYVCKLLCTQTHGTYSVIVDGEHFKDLLMSCCMPPPALKESVSNLVKMGFPKHSLTNDSLSLCVCHNTASSSKNFTESGYFCPQCKAKYCSLPVECKICGLTLVSGPQLARTYQHLFPLPTFEEVLVEKLSDKSCFACLLAIEKKAYKCGKCDKIFCIDCDLYLHESLQTCPGCSY